MITNSYVIATLCSRCIGTVLFKHLMSPVGLYERTFQRSKVTSDKKTIIQNDVKL